MIDAFKTNGSSPPSDFELFGHGTLYSLQPLTPAARAWVDEHLPDDAMVWCGAIVVEPRYLGDIVRGAIADGLQVA